MKREKTPIDNQGLIWEMREAYHRRRIGILSRTSLDGKCLRVARSLTVEQGEHLERIITRHMRACHRHGVPMLDVKSSLQEAIYEAAARVDAQSIAIAEAEWKQQLEAYEPGRDYAHIYQSEVKPKC